jgi:L-threonylcarbamoyladenylate synthase
MPTVTLPADAAAIAKGATLLRGGGLVAFPTETVYGLAANAFDSKAVAGIFAAKGRPGVNPLIVHVAELEEARRMAGSWPPLAQCLAERFWPGPLTLIVPTSPDISDLVTAGGPTVALRVPAHPVALALLRESGLPLAAPSANRSSRLSPTRAEHVLADLDGRIDMVLDGGPAAGGIESTVLDVSVAPPQLLRPGPVSPGDIEAVIGKIGRESMTSPGAPLRSPGLLARHYAPRTPLECVVDDGWSRVRTLLEHHLRVGWLTIGESSCNLDPPNGAILAMPVEPATYAAQLYAALHTMDAMRLDRIVVALPPPCDAWLAIRDRLQRAAMA